MQIATRSPPRRKQEEKREGRAAFACDRPISEHGFTVSRSRTHTHSWDYTFPRIARLIPAKFVPIRQIISRRYSSAVAFPTENLANGLALTLRKKPMIACRSRTQKSVSRNSNVLMARVALPGLLHVSSSLRWSPVEGFFFLSSSFFKSEGKCNAISGGCGHVKCERNFKSELPVNDVTRRPLDTRLGDWLLEIAFRRVLLTGRGKIANELETARPNKIFPPGAGGGKR